MPSQTNIFGQSALTAAISASSAQAAPQAVKTWTANAAVRGELAFSGELVGPIMSSLHVKSKIVRNLSDFARLSTVNQRRERHERHIQRRGGGHRRRAGRPCCGHRAGNGRRRHALDRAAGRARSPHHGAPCRLGHGAGNARCVAGLRCRTPRRCAKSASSTRRQRLIRAPEVLFAAAEIGLDAFGHNIENRHLIAALEAHAAALKLPRIADAALSIASDTAGVTIKHADGEARVQDSSSAPTAGARCAAPRPASAPAADLSADGADAQSGARAAAR